MNTKALCKVLEGLGGVSQAKSIFAVAAFMQDTSRHCIERNEKWIIILLILWYCIVSYSLFNHFSQFTFLKKNKEHFRNLHVILHKIHANFLCIIPILLYVLPKWAHSLLFIPTAIITLWRKHCYLTDKANAEDWRIEDYQETLKEVKGQKPAPWLWKLCSVPVGCEGR